MKNFLITSAAFLALTACVSSDDYDTPGINPLTCTKIDLATGTAPYVQSFTGQATGAISDTFDWKTVTEDGSRAFDIQDFSKANPYLQMSSFGSGSTNKTWIISPTFDFSTVTDKFISFTLADAYQNGNPVKLKYSTDYTGADCPSKATWTEIGATEIAALINNTAKYDNKFESTGDIAVPATGKVVFAIVYEGSSAGITTTVQIDDIKIGQKSVVTPPTLALKTLTEIRALGVGAVIPAGTKIEGIVISDKDNVSIDSKNMIIQDGSFSGIVIRFSAAHTFAKNDKVEIDVSGLTVAEYQGALQIVVDNAKATKTAVETAIPQTVTIGDLLTNGENYESELVKIVGVSYPEANGTKTFSGSIKVEKGAENIPMYTRSGFTALVAEKLPTGTGDIIAIASQNGTAYQLIPRDVAEVLFTTTPPPATGNLLFPGSDFENWTTFTGSLNSSGLKSYAVQSTNGYNGSTGALHLNGTPTGNDYVFTAVVPSTGFTVPTSKIEFYIKGTAAKSLSLNLYKTDGTYYKFNLDDCSSDKVLVPVPSNLYVGTINTGGNWVEVTLDISEIQDIATTSVSDLIALKVGKSAAYDLLIDNITMQ